MSDDKKRGGGGLLGWLRGDKRAEETGRVPVVKLDAVKLDQGGGNPAAARDLKRDVTERYSDKGEVARGGMGSIRKVFDDNLQRCSSPFETNVAPGVLLDALSAYLLPWPAVPIIRGF